MRFHFPMALFTGILFLQKTISANDVLIDHVPVATICNPNPSYSLINSIERHPKQNLFCVTYTHNNKVILYKINDLDKVEMVQSLSNPLSKLSEPQHAAFSPDGRVMVVANWTNQTLTVYQNNEEGLFQEEPAAVIPSPSSLNKHKPHGIAFSPCGNYFAIAYGAASYHGKAVALFSVQNENLEYELIHMLQGSDELPGIPKGITFTPDGTCLLVTFSDTNSLVIFNLSENNETILKTPRQVIQGEESKISRPEDVKISANGSFCAISNSDQGTVTFYPFDKTSNQITQSTPCDILQNPEASLHFPHGITFSADGSFMLVTGFGQVETAEDGNIRWNSTTSPEEAKFNVYKLI